MTSPKDKYFEDDPLWYKDAVIYELPIKSFSDSNEDGIGDFRGLIGKLDYLEGLGRDGTVAPAVLSIAAQGRRVRHRQILRRPSPVRDPERLQGFSCARHTSEGCASSSNWC